MAANLVNPAIRSKFEVFVLPNLYGDIITDEAAQIQGGVGTAGSANVGGRYAMFEAVHGSAPRMIEEGIGELANPASIIKADEMLLRHVGFAAEADKLAAAMQKCSDDPTLHMTGERGGSTAREYADKLLAYISAD